MSGPHAPDDELDDEALDKALDKALDDAFDAAGAAGDGESLVSPSVLDRIAEIAGETPKVTLHESGTDKTSQSLESGDSQQAGKYVVLDALGEGAVGIVHRGRDQDLGRDVAMKFLQEKYKDHPSVLYRFVEEAQIGGQLQHPGIVPVYDLGMSDGKPFFTMKLIQGQTLAKLLSERESSAADRGRFLGIFEQICQTMAYAHAHGVVHRDLKPSNVMIGAFGEVQVVDWGMGKVLQAGAEGNVPAGKTPETQGTTVETVRTSSDESRSILGTVMGTPAYMPPEQAMGQVDQLDERSDVFALGAILCEILTGTPPYVGKPGDLLRMAAAGELGDAHTRLERCGAEADIIALARQCLMSSRADRPESAVAVAQTVQQHLASAEQRAHEANVRAAALKRTQKLGISLTATITVGLAASLWFWHAADEAAANEKTARDAAEAHLANFNHLSHVVHLKTARARARTLFPAHAHMIPRMRDWLDNDAKPLHNSLGELRATLATLEKRTLEQTPAEKAESRRAHPRAAELDQLKKKLAFMRHAQAVRSGSAQPAPFVLNETGLPKTALALKTLSARLSHPTRKVYGREAEGLAMAQKALALATDEERAEVLDTLAWALFTNGRDDEAVIRMKEALAAARSDERQAYERYNLSLEAWIASVSKTSSVNIDNAEREIAALEAEINRSGLRFASRADFFLYSTLRKLVADIERFEKTEVVQVKQRLFWAERVEELTVTRYRERWDKARLAIARADGVTASKLYRAAPIELDPQTGLVPIGMNPVTKLWEFYHLRSAWDPRKGGDPGQLPIPKHNEDGTLPILDSGMVFVLIPGGKFFMGSQNQDEDAPNYDPFAQSVEGPVHEVELAPYFLSRYEMTQGQWARLTEGDYPSWYKIGRLYTGIPGLVDFSHPVEKVNWERCQQVLTRHGLVLPTEAQWERGCRAGTKTPWFTGTTRSSLAGFANILDQTGQNIKPVWPGGEAFDDGFKGPAPVGSFAANPFGLHDVYGNVHEWCRDWYCRFYTTAPRPGDGLRDPGLTTRFRMFRGGSYTENAQYARSAVRNRTAPTSSNSNVGVRPARAMTR